MKKSLKTAAVTLIVSSFLLSGCNSIDNAKDTTSNSFSATTQKADKIEVVHFHGTRQCWSCITVGEYALKTIEKKFPNEYKNKTIVFKDINGELEKNYNTVMKYQARGSSLFVNAIINGKENIEEDIKVWRLVSDEKQFMQYFEEKLNNLLEK